MKLSFFTLREKRTRSRSVTVRSWCWRLGKRPPPPGMTEEAYSDIRRAIDEDRVEAAHLSRNPRFVLDSNSGHNIQLDDPKAVADAVEQVVAAVKNRTKLDH